MDWIKAIANWIRGLTEPKKERVQFLKKYRYCGNTLTLLANEESGDIPGLVSLWELSRTESRYCLIILLVNIAQSKDAIGKIPDPNSSYQRRFEIQAKTTIRQQEETIMGSHLLLVGRISKEADRERWVNGKQVKFKHIDFLAAHVLNLQSEASVLIAGQNFYAARIVEAIVKKLLRLTPTELNTWDEFIAAWPWLDWIEYFACKNKQTKFPEKEGHNIQPPRAKKARPLRSNL